MGAAAHHPAGMKMAVPRGKVSAPEMQARNFPMMASNLAGESGPGSTHPPLSQGNRPSTYSRMFYPARATDTPVEQELRWTLFSTCVQG